jgi:hypothetical protein
MTNSITDACICLSDAGHRIKKTPAERVVTEYLAMAKMYQENADAYKNAALRWSTS